MKVWIKYLIGIALGVVAALVLPLDGAKSADVLGFLSQLFINFGRYLVIPIVFSSVIVSICKLRSSKLILKTTIWTFSIIVISSLLLTLVGLLAISIVKLPRIPITIDGAAELVNINIKSLLLSLFPLSAFDSLTEGSFLLVSFVFAFLIGWECASEESTYRPIFSFVDALSKLFYNIAVFFTEIMSVFIIAVVCNWTITFRSLLLTGIYTPLIIMLLCTLIFVIGIVYPLIIRYVCHDPHPYKVLFASVAPMLLGFFSADSNLVLPMNIRHGKESLGIRRRCSGFTYPLFSVFARGGSSLVATICFILIWRSYSSLSIPFADVMWIFFASFGLSFLLCGIPSGGVLILLTFLCEIYGKGFETSFHLLKPASLIICSFSTVFDVATAMFGSYIVAVKTKMIEHHTVQHFI
jgi:Na+/H+-dicarboxylate symporter